jgi:hypothetical protein
VSSGVYQRVEGHELLTLEAYHEHMRVMAIVIAVVAVGVFATLGVAGTEAKPALRAASSKPLVVVGTGFAASERVTVTALTPLRSRSVRVSASRLGVFRARLGWFTQPCGKPFSVRARGTTGSTAAMRLPAPPCVPPPVS